MRNFPKFAGKHLYQSFVFNKVTSLRSATLLRKRIRHRCFPVNFAKCLRTAFFIEHLRWLLRRYHNQPNFYLVCSNYLSHQTYRLKSTLDFIFDQAPEDINILNIDKDTFCNNFDSNRKFLRFFQQNYNISKLWSRHSNAS